jgi:hypothetical protein
MLDCGLNMLRKKPIGALLLKGRGFNCAVSNSSQASALQAAEKLDFDLICIKGTALAGPIKPIESTGL